MKIKNPLMICSTTISLLSFNSRLVPKAVFARIKSEKKEIDRESKDSSDATLDGREV
jgi:hypothetical protein